MLVSLMLGVIGLPYQLIFIIATLGVTLLVEARGLFLTVASIPILFGIFTPLTSWFVSQQGVAANVSLVFPSRKSSRLFILWRSCSPP